MPEAPEEILDLAARRAGARDAGDFAGADALRDEIAHAGWAVVDEPTGWRLEPSRPAAPHRVRAHDVPSVLERPVTYDATLAWVVEGWAQDVERAIASFRSVSGSSRLQFVIADVTGAAPDGWGAGVEVLSLEDGTGWASAMNAALRRCRGAIVMVLDGSVEATGDVLPPLHAGLADPSVGVCGPFGIVTDDLQEFRRVEAPGECDAVESYLMAFRRETLVRVGGFDERFTWYRSADIEWSFRVRDAGLRVLAVAAPIETHEHRMWEAVPPDERDARSRRNFSRFLDRWRGRWDLTVRGAPPDAG